MKGQKVLFSHQSDEHGTPQWLYDKLHAKYEFTLDPCATRDNTKCFLFYDKSSDGLTKPWYGHNVFVNPPYSGVADWVDKALREIKFGGCHTVVMLLPVRTDQKWFTRFILPNYSKIIYIEGRLKFEGQENSAPFPSMIVVFKEPSLDHTIEVWSNKP